MEVARKILCVLDLEGKASVGAMLRAYCWKNCTVVSILLGAYEETQGRLSLEGQARLWKKGGPVSHCFSLRSA
jgi:hypothetical protein